MSIVQLPFESRFEPPSVIGQWWKHYGMGGGTKLPNPLAATEVSTCGGYEDDLWVNLELWSKPDSKETIGRLSAQSEPFGETQVRSVLRRVIDSLQPPPGRQPSQIAFAPDSFTWIGGWDWTTENSDPGHWGMTKLDEILATAPRGLCAADGTLICDGSKTAKFGFVHAPSRAVFLGYDYLGLNPDALEIKIIEGCGSVPLTSIPGVRVLKSRTNVYSAAATTDGMTLACIEYSNSIEFGRGYISLIDAETGEARKLTWFGHASGGEQIAFSPDDRWLLIPRTGRDYGALIIDVMTGAQRSFDDINHASCWWVRDGRLGLLSIGSGAYDTDEFDPYMVSFFDLTSGETKPVAKITPPGFTLEPLYRSLWTAEPHADGRVLLDMCIPPANEHYFAHRTLVILDLATGSLQQVIEPFADPTKYIVRQQKNWHWNSPLGFTATEHPALLDQGLFQIDMSLWPDFKDEYGAVIRVSFDSPFFGN